MQKNNNTQVYAPWGANNNSYLLSFLRQSISTHKRDLWRSDVFQGKTENSSNSNKWIIYNAVLFASNLFKAGVFSSFLTFTSVRKTHFSLSPLLLQCSSEAKERLGVNNHNFSTGFELFTRSGSDWWPALTESREISVVHFRLLLWHANIEKWVINISQWTLFFETNKSARLALVQNNNII